jgi:ubiquinone/menaquinone biosynthesis C-methylase UbiE
MQTSDPSNFVGDIPRHYDDGLGPVLFERFAEDLVERVAALQPRRVLELAAGTGIVTRRLAKCLHGTQLVATDLNAPMLEFARRKLDGAERVEFAVANAMALEFIDASFDAITCQFGVMFFPDKIASFREAWRVLRPGGTYLFNTWGTLAENSFAGIADDLCRTFFPADPPTFYKVPFSYAAVDQIIADCRAAGFVEVDAEVVRFEQPVTDWPRFTRGIVFGNPLVQEVIQRGSITPEALRLEIESHYRQTFGDSPTQIPLQAVVISARR